MSASKQKPEEILDRLEWTVLKRLDGFLQGDYRTLFRGFGLDLADLREYQFGDDIRHIDWNVTARMNSPYVRQFNEDREITAWFLLDVSPSIDFGSEDRTKRSVLIEIVTTMSRLLTRHGNRVGAIFYSGKVEQVIPARGGRNHVLLLLSSLLSQPELREAPATRLSDLLETAYRIIGRRSFVFFISDFYTAPGWERPLELLARRHELLAVRVFDPFELELPDLGMLPIRDSETGEQLFVDTHDKGFRRRFSQEADRHEAEVRNALRGAGVDALEISTRDDLVESLLRFAEMRRERSTIASGSSPVNRWGGGAS